MAFCPERLGMHLIDTHAHLDFSDFDDDRPDVIERAAEADVKEIISIGTDLETSARALELASNFPSVWCTVGVHPNEAAHAGSDFIDELRRLAESPRVVALGEIGLDYHRLPSSQMPDPSLELAAATVSQDPDSFSQSIADGAAKNQQAIVFREQLDLAVELGLPVVIHQRDCWEDTLAILREYQSKVRGVFHCFGATLEQAQEVIALGHLVSFTGIATFKNAQQVHETITGLDEGTFMVETDCPYLAPVPHRGKRCEPAYTRLVAERLATLRETSIEAIAEQTTATAMKFFHLK